MIVRSLLIALMAASNGGSFAGPDPQIERALARVTAARAKEDIEKLVGFHTRLATSTELPPQGGRGVRAARDFLRAQFEADGKACGGCLEVRLLTFTTPPSKRVPKATELDDVYAIQKGTDPEAARRMIVVVGHYDSIALAKFDDPSAFAPGANDDGSGTTVVLEAARVLSRMRFPATLVYLAVSGEEQGLLGSGAFAELARKQGWDLEAVLSDDIVGGDRSPGQDPGVVRIFSEGLPLAALGDGKALARLRLLGYESDSPSRELARYVARIAGAYARAVGLRAQLVFRQDRFLRGGDHLSFNRMGFPAVRFTEERENFRHQHQVVRTEGGVEYGDLPKFVDFDYLAKVARLNLAVLASLAAAPAPPADVAIETRQLENDTTLTWHRSPGGRVRAYEVVWRETTSPEWEKVLDVGTQTRVTLPLSKDNLYFGVRAVDAAGHRSVVTVAMPER